MDKIFKYDGYTNGGVYQKGKPFNLLYQNIKIIGLSLRLVGDTEDIFLILIDTKGNEHAISSYALNNKEAKDLFKHFSINENWYYKWEWEDYEDRKSVVLYPKSLQDQDLYNKIHWSKSIFKYFLAFWGIGHIAKGTLSSNVSKYLYSL